ncbi:hypothetical protein [Sphingomonas sp. 22R3R2A-7]|uniref:hypothetical protein n=1 Tax=Sphingomonas sp. 22R3R2A-7 TaxID=3050230 RepID=UPI002FE3EABF
MSSASGPNAATRLTTARLRQRWPLFLRIFVLILGTVLLVQVLNFAAVLLVPPPRRSSIRRAGSPRLRAPGATRRHCWQSG